MMVKPLVIADAPVKEGMPVKGAVQEGTPRSDRRFLVFAALVMIAVTTVSLDKFFVLRLTRQEALQPVPEEELFKQVPELSSGDQVGTFAARVKLLDPTAELRATSVVMMAPPPPSTPPPKPATPSWVLESRLAPRPARRVDAPLPTAPDAAWAYEVLDARPGVVLVGGHSFPPELSIFNGAAVLLLKVCGCHPNIFGVILTKPSNDTMASAFCPVAAKRYPSFLNSTLRYGGPVGPAWTVLHPQPLSGSMEVLPGLSVGGALSELQQLVTAGRATPSDALFFSGVAAFRIDDLQAQLRAKRWKAYKTSAALLTKPAVLSRRGALAEAIAHVSL